MLATARRGAESVENVGRVDSAATRRIAVLSPKGAGAAGRSQDDVVFVPLSMAKSRLIGTANIGTRDSLDLISVKVTDSAELPEAKSQIETLLRTRHRLRGDAPDDFSVEDPADILHARAGAARALACLLSWPPPQ